MRRAVRRAVARRRVVMRRGKGLRLREVVS
jgi:hypothetical protein